MFEQTLFIIKPDGMKMERQIIDILKKAGLYNVVKFKILIATREQILAHYGYENNEPWLLKRGKKFINWRLSQNLPIEKSQLEYGQEIADQIMTYMTSGKIKIIILAGENIIQRVRDIIGDADSAQAQPGTIRSLSKDSYHLARLENRAMGNLAHASNSQKAAAQEIKIWFD